MKLRIRGNSLRLRLLRGEVAQLRASEKVSETINFGNSTLTYTLQISDSVTEISADFRNDEIAVSLPKELARQWIETEQVGLETAQDIPGAESLNILIEKDFICLDRPHDPDNADAYAHA